MKKIPIICAGILVGLNGCGRRVGDIPRNISVAIGIEERDDRDAMMDGHILKPPKEFRKIREEEQKKDKVYQQKEQEKQVSCIVSC